MYVSVELPKNPNGMQRCIAIFPRMMGRSKDQALITFILGAIFQKALWIDILITGLQFLYLSDLLIVHGTHAESWF